MRILMITDFYWPFVGGVEQHVRRLSQGLVVCGHELAVATLGHEGLAEFDYDQQVRVYRVRSTMQRMTWLFAHLHRPWAPPFPDPEVTRALRPIIRQERPDIVHGHDWLARSFLPLKASSGARFVMSLHYYTLSCAKKSLMRKDAPCSGPAFPRCLGCAANHYGLGKGISIVLANWMMNVAERAAVDVFLPVSRATAAGNGLTSRDPYQIIPNFMPDNTGITGDVEPYLAQLPDQEFLLFVGDLRRDKGIEVLLAAYAGLSGAPPLVLIGKVWPDTPTVFPPDVIVLKNWPNEAVLAAWERTLMAIVPSLWAEPFGIVIIEAMSSGRPIIASRIGGIPDIVSDGETGLLVAPGDPEALRQAIERLLADPALRERMGQAARKEAATYQASAIVPRIERIYQALLQNQRETHEPTASGEHYHQQL